MKKLKFKLTQPERALIFFTAQNSIPSSQPESNFAGQNEGLFYLYRCSLQSIFFKNWRLWEREDITLKLTGTEAATIFFLITSEFPTITTSEALTAARSVIWKIQPMLNKF